MGGNWKRSLKVRPLYGVSWGPWIVPVQIRREEGEGKAEIEGGVESIRVISSCWRLWREWSALEVSLKVMLHNWRQIDRLYSLPDPESVYWTWGAAYRLVTLCAS